MAVTLVDHRTVVNEADAITNWTGTVTLFTSDPTPIEATGEVGATVGVAVFDSYVTITSDDFSDAVIYCWVFSRLALGNTTDANGGLMVTAGDTTNLGAWKVAGADRAAFRHDDGPTGWQCPALDTTSLPSSPLSRAGSAASVNFAAITRVGTTVNSLVAAPGMNPTYLVDIIRVLEVSLFNGCALSVTGGTSGTPGKWSEIAAADRGVATGQAHGIVRQLGTGAFGVQGPLRFGDGVGTTSSWFEDSNVAVIFESRGFRTNLYKIFITDNGTGLTTFILTNSSITAPTGIGAEFDAGTDTDVTDVFINSCVFSGFTNGVSFRTGHEFTNGTITASGAVTAGGADMTNTRVLLSTVAADASALVWNVNTDTNGLLDGMMFSKGTNAHHAIQLGTSSPTTVSIVGMTFTSFNASNEQNDSALYLSDRGSDVTWTINVTGNSPSYKRARGTDTVNIVSSVNVTVTIKDSAGNVIPGAEVAIFQDNAARTVVLASTSTNASGQVTTTAASSLGTIIIRTRQSTDTMSFLTSESTTDGVNSTLDEISNPTLHNFQTGDAVVYDKDGGSVSISGSITDGNTYYVRAVDTTSVKLYASAANAISDTSAFNLTASGTETHKLDPVRFVAGSATGTIGASDFSTIITMNTDIIATG